MREWPNAARTVRVMHAVALWTSIALLLLYAVWSKFFLPRVQRKVFRFCLFFIVCGVFFSAVCLLVSAGGTSRGRVACATWVGGAVWWALLLCFTRRRQIPNGVFIFLFSLLILMEWSIVSLQIMSFAGPTTDLLADVFFALPHTLALVALVDWGWLMVHGVASTFPQILLHELNAAHTGESGHDNNAASFATLPLSDELRVDVFAPQSLSLEMRFGRRRFIIREIAQRWGLTYMALALVRLLFEFGGLLPAYFLRGLVDNLMQANSGGVNKTGEEVERNGGDIQTCAVMILLIIICTVVCTFLRVHYNMRLQKIALHNRNFLTMELFCCALGRRKHQFGSQTEGDIMNHLSVDVQRVANAVQTLNDLWALPVQLAFALYLLYIQVSFAFMAGVMVTLLLIPVNMYLTKRIKHVQTKFMQANDERVFAITEIVNNILYVKMCGWSRIVRQWVGIPREKYMTHLSWLKYLDAFCVFFWAVTPTLVSLLTFVTFMWMGGKLTTSKAITALALFGSLILPLNAYPWVINGFLEAYVSWRRLQPFLEMPLQEFCRLDGGSLVVFEDDVGDDDDKSVSDVREGLLRTRREKGDDGNTHLPGSGVQSSRHAGLWASGAQRAERFQHSTVRPRERVHHGVLVSVDEGEVVFNAPTGDFNTQESFTLRIPKFQASRGQLVALVGSSGSGKSVFLDILAGERLLQPSYALNAAHASMAYVEQRPFLVSGTIRENILFGLAYDSIKYSAAIKAVALTEDLCYNFTPDGDKTLVGDRGGRLSGGQKVRVALARALYADRDLYLVDDILGCLDTTVSRHIVREVLLMLARSGRCVVVATHNEELIRSADVVYACDNGWLVPRNHVDATVASSATETTRRITTAAAIELQGDDAMPQEEGENEPKEEEEREKIRENLEKDTTLPTSFLASSLEASQRGAIAWGTVMCYLGRVGWELTALILVSVLAMQAARNASDQYVVVWSKDGDGDTVVFLRVLALIALVNCLLALVRGFSFAAGGLRAARRLHDELLHHLFSATYKFYSNTSPGRIINRLSADVYTIDDSLPFIANILLARIFLLAGSIVIIMINSTALIILMLPFVSLLYYRIQFPYRHVSRALRRLESAARAPLLDALRVMLDGGVVIRSLGGDAFRFHMRQAQGRLEVLSNAEFNALLLNAWFSLRLELVGVLFLAFVGALALYHHGGSHAPLLGMAFAYVQPLTSYVGGLLDAFASTEKELISVERVRQYFSLEREETTPGDAAWFSVNAWTFEGKIDFVDVTMRYDSCGQEVLRGLTFHVKAGEKIAIVGRTGAGKSSIFLALLRLVTLESGCITIDDDDIRRLPLEVLRTSLGVIPQQPFIFHGTLRKNVDPFNKYTDDAIRAALACVGLDTLSLDFNILDSGYVHGGKQHLIAVARVLLQRSRVLLLDEPTSQLCSEAESSLWRALDVYMRDTTVICITHKLAHINFFDRVIVIDKGSVVNSGPPSLLRRDRVWPFSKNNVT